MWTRLSAYVRGILRRKQAASEAEEELAFHVEQETHANLARGLPPSEARRIALVAIGGVRQATERVRGVRATWLDTLVRDWLVAWRGVRTRGWRATFVVALLAVTLGANATMFAVVDSLVLHPHPYPDADRVASIRGKVRGGERLDRRHDAALYTAWRQQPDLVAAVGGYLTKTVFIKAGTTDKVRTADVTVDLFDVLGVRPRWGRGFADADLADTNGYASILGEALARRYFGRPERALGQRLEVTGGGGPLLIVGVMPAGFTFPQTGIELWRALDPAGPLTLNFGGVPILARPADGLEPAAFTARLAERAPAVGRAAGLDTYTATATPFFKAPPPSARRTMLFVLLGAALALLLLSCVNIASLELATAIHRGRTVALRLALGAPRAALARVALLECVLLTGAAFGGGWGLAALGTLGVAGWLPASFAFGTTNPVHLSVRALGFMATAAGLAWLLASVAPVVAVVRSSASPVLSAGWRATIFGRRGARLRQILAAAQVALAVGLVITGAMYARSYVALMRVDKGFDSYGLAEVTASVPANYFPAVADRDVFITRLLANLQAVPGVIAATEGEPPPGEGDSPMQTTLEIDGRDTGAAIRLGRNNVQPSYFPTIGLPLRSGRYLQSDDPRDDVVIGESLARRFWPGGAAVGHTLRGQEQGFFSTPMTIVGVVGDFRSEATHMPTTEDARYFVYSNRQPAKSGPVPQGQRFPDNGGSYGMVTVTVRTDGPSRVSAVRAAAERTAPQLAFTVDLVDDTYAEQHADVRLTTQVVGAFSLLAFAVAMAGLYGVMAFLVASQTREIGIRLALGASPTEVRHLVLSSATRLVVLGAGAGAIVAGVIARSVQSQLFGVSGVNWQTYVAVLASTIVTALIAAWHPAWQAARVDPATTLRAE